jgi:hypothetical protein
MKFVYFFMCLCLIVLTACAQDTGLIDRTQVNRLAKADLGGVWYEFQVVSSMPSSAAFGFVGQSNFGGKTGKVVFDVQENFVVVYPYAESVLGADAAWNKRKIRKYWDESVRNRAGSAVLDSDFVEVVVGNPIEMYPIISHFDIKRDYAPSTGAQSNVLVENTTDRPWWQRDYVRVDWMGNTMSNFAFPQGAVTLSPVDYFVQGDDLENPNHFYEDPDGGYFHFTRHMFGQPMSTGACSPYALAPGDCAGAAFEIRVSYKRADARHLNDYEIRPYHNAGPSQKFGFFLADRYAYNEDYGLTYSGHDYKAARWNIWQKSKEFTTPKDKGGVEVHAPCLSNHDCTAPQVCDQDDWFRPGECKIGQRLDYSQRGIRPIVYHLSAGTPVDHMPAEYATADDWDDVFRDTASWLLFWEDKWRADTPTGQTGFSDPQAHFGQRFCQTNADCAQHAVATVDLHLVQNATGTAKWNFVVIAAGMPGQKAQAIVLDDSPATRPTVPTGGAWLSFVNATPGSAPATLSVGGVQVSDIAFVPGTVASASQGSVLAGGDLKATEATVSAGAATATLGNLGLKAGESYTFIFLGDDTLVMLRSSLSAAQLRAVNAVASHSDAGAASAGDDLNVGGAGVQMASRVPFATASSSLFFAGQNPQVAFLRPGSRTDVSCVASSGVGTCAGWKQELTQADADKRAQLKSTVPPVFVLCENVFTAHKDVCDQRGETGKATAQNDCRYWRQDGDTWRNPCADVNDGGFVRHAGEPKIVGDTRYNLLYWVTNVEPTSPLGYGPAAADPDTGEIQWACANVYGAQLVTYAQYAKDLVDLLNGDLSDADLKTGKYIKDYLAKQARSGLNKSAFMGAALPDVDGDPAHSLAAAQERAQLRMADKAPAFVQSAPPTPEQEHMLRDIANPLGLAKVLDAQGLTFDPQLALDHLKKIQGTPLERALINDEVALTLSNGAVQPGDAIAPELIEKLSPTGWATPQRAMEEHKRMLLMGTNAIELAEFYDPAIVGLAQRLACKDGQDPTTNLPDPTQIDAPGNFAKQCYKGDALRTALSVAIFRATIEHEVGHTMGLRHNFEGSADLLNYFDQYFDPNTGRERETVPCADLSTPAGPVAADQLCGRDLYGRNLFGETCVYSQCLSDDDCPRGTACSKATKQCVDADGVKTGVCNVKTPVVTACTDDSACGDAGVCVAGVCNAKVPCSTPSKCGTGGTCDGGFCVNAHTGAPQSTPSAQTTTGPARKYLPRAQMTQNEIDHRRMEYQYSTVMDYGQKIHSDIHGLGKYDYAAIRYGYGELVDVYADTSFLRNRVQDVAKRENAAKPDVIKWSVQMETTGWQFDVITPQLSVISDWMPPEYNRKRDAVPEFLVNLEMGNAFKPTNVSSLYGRNDIDRTYLEVPYKYCSDEFVGILGCNRFDTGATAEEIVYHAGESIEEYYLFDAFKREKQWFAQGGNPLGYMARITDRWLTPLATAGRYYALYNNILRFYPWFPAFDQQESGFAQMHRASQAAFRKLASMIASPAPGAYVYDKAQNLYVNTSYDDAAPGEAHVTLGPGKYPWTTFAHDKGYFYADHPLWIGAYWDKVAAISVMTNSTVSLITESAGEQLPLFRGTAIGFNTIYPRELMAVLGGLVAGDAATIGGLFVADQTGQKVYQPADPFRSNTNTAPRVQPSILNLTLRLQAAWMAVANLPAGFDPSYTDSMAVWLKGNGLQYTISTGQIGGQDAKVQLVEFNDPFGTKTYVAPKPNYDADRYSPTYRMLQRLNTWKTGCNDGLACSAGVCPDGSACAVDSLATTTGAAQDAIAAKMKAEIEIVDYMRQLFAIYGAIGAGN